MTFNQLSRMTIFLILIGQITSCDSSPDLEHAPQNLAQDSLGAAEMKQCRILSGESIELDALISRLSDFAIGNGLKFLDDRTNGRNGSYMQIDQPYIVFDHAYFSQRSPPEHMFLSFSPARTSDGERIEEAYFSFIETLGPTTDCGGFQAAITPGWRLPD